MKISKITPLFPPQTGRSTVTGFKAAGQVSRTADLAGNRTFYEDHASGAGGRK